MTPRDRQRKVCEEEIKESEEPEEDQRRAARRPPRTDEAPSTHLKTFCYGMHIPGRKTLGSQ